MNISFTKSITIKPLDAGNPYRTGTISHSIEVQGTDDYGNYSDIFYCSANAVERILEYIESPNYKLTLRTKIW